jgi:hypothetical protein
MALIFETATQVLGVTAQSASASGPGGEEEEEELSSDSGGEEQAEEGELKFEGTVASFSSTTLVVVGDEDELTFDITGVEIEGTLAQDVEVEIEAEDSPDGLVATTVTVKGESDE